MLVGARACSVHSHVMGWCLGILRDHVVLLVALVVQGVASGFAARAAVAADTVIAAMIYGKGYLQTHSQLRTARPRTLF